MAGEKVAGELWTASFYQISEWDQTVCLEPPVVYHMTPDSDELKCKSRKVKRRFDQVPGTRMAGRVGASILLASVRLCITVISLSLSLSHTHTHSLALSFSHTYTHALTHSRALSLSFSLSLAISLSLSLSPPPLFLQVPGTRMAGRVGASILLASSPLTVSHICIEIDR